MTPSILRCLLLSLPAAVAVFAQAASDDEIRKILIDRIDAQHQGLGIVVGIVDAKGRRIVAYGQTGKDLKRPLDGDTVFEIGSITKVFTSLAMTDMVQHGTVALTDPVSKFLPAAAKVPERGGKKITLKDLSTQVSGLPRLPTNFQPKDQANPYADFAASNLYAFLSSYELPRDIGSKWEYSNLGTGLLGFALARKAGTDYETLIRTRIAVPLDMRSTAIKLTPEMKARMAAGHNDKLEPVPNWDFDALAGCGALRSTANDLLTFLAANLGIKESPLAPAMTAMLKADVPTSAPGFRNALGWQVSGDIVWKDGGTYGYSSFIAYDTKTRTGVVVLSNTFTLAGVSDIGTHLLDPVAPLTPAATVHKEITVDSKTIDSYLGRYQLAPNFILTITRDGPHVFAQATNQAAFEVFAEANREFFARITDIQISFQVDGSDRVTGLTLHQAGNNIPAKRMEGDAHKAIQLDPKIFDGYVGRYQLAPNFVVSITRKGDHFFAEGTGQEPFEIFAETNHDFFAKIEEILLTFKTDDKGKATGLVLHQAGQDVPAKRIE